MADSNESFVQVAPDAGGKKIRNLKIGNMLQSDGTYADVYIQCIVAVDKNGFAIDSEEQLEYMKEMLRELRSIRIQLNKLNGELPFGSEEADHI